MDMRERMQQALIAAQRAGERKNFHEVAQKRGPERHQADLQGLYHGLAPESARHLDAILARRHRLLDPAVKSYRDLYQGEDWDAFARYEAFTKEIVPESGAFRYKDFLLPSREFTPAVFLYEHGLPALRTLDDMGDGVIIDGGGAHGDSLLVFRKYLRNPIHSFEPHPGMRALLRQTLRLNAALLGDDVTVVELALADTTGTQVFMTDNGSSSQIDPGLTSGVGAETVTLDDYVSRHGLRVSLVKLDIEGHEQPFLRGAVQTLKTQKPRLIISNYHSYDDFFHIKTFIEQLDCGYEFDFFKGVDASVWASIMLLCEAPGAGRPRN